MGRIPNIIRWLKTRVALAQVRCGSNSRVGMWDKCFVRFYILWLCTMEAATMNPDFAGDRLGALRKKRSLICISWCPHCHNYYTSASLAREVPNKLRSLSVAPRIRFAALFHPTALSHSQVLNKSCLRIVSAASRCPRPYHSHSNHRSASLGPPGKRR